MPHVDIYIWTLNQLKQSRCFFSVLLSCCFFSLYCCQLRIKFKPNCFERDRQSDWLPKWKSLRMNVHGVWIWPDFDKKLSVTLEGYKYWNTYAYTHTSTVNSGEYAPKQFIHVPMVESFYPFNSCCKWVLFVFSVHTLFFFTLSTSIYACIIWDSNDTVSHFTIHCPEYMWVQNINKEAYKNNNKKLCVCKERKRSV